MNTVTKLKLKSAFLRAALHLQMAPMLFIPSALFLVDKHLATRKGFTKYLERSKSKLHEVPLDHPIYELVTPLAKMAKIEVLSIIKDESIFGCGYAAIFSRKNYVQLSFSERALDDASKNTAFLKSIIGHELTHASRRACSFKAAFSGSWFSATIAGFGFYFPLAFALPIGGAVASASVGAASIFSAAYGIPKLLSALYRNEEYLADIGSGELTGEPHNMAGFLKEDLPYDEIFREREKRYKTEETRYGFSHPDHADRIAVLCDAFNMKPEDLPVPVNSARSELDEAIFKIYNPH